MLRLLAESQLGVDARAAGTEGMVALGGTPLTFSPHGELTVFEAGVVVADDALSSTDTAEDDVLVVSDVWTVVESKMWSTSIDIKLCSAVWIEDLELSCSSLSSSSTTIGTQVLEWPPLFQCHCRHVTLQ
jgi:hypothetical protein